MAEVNIQNHINQYSDVVNRMLANGTRLSGDDASEMDLAAIEIVQQQLIELRSQIVQPSREYLGHRIIEHDFEPLMELFCASQHAVSFHHTIKANESGRISAIELFGGGFGSLGSIECLTELEHVRLDNVDVLDCSPLSKLPHLQSLYAFSNLNLNMSTFGGMAALKKFSCDQCCVGDLTWISGCPNIGYLKVTSCHIDSIDKLTSCKRLEVLDISHNPVHSIAALTGHANIRKLCIQDTDITDFSPLISMPVLRELYVSSDIEELPSFRAVLPALSKMSVMIVGEHEVP